MRIVFICTGNTCRSPMAEALCKKRLADRFGCTPDELRQRGYEILSAGLAAYPGGPAANEAVEAVTGYGADLSNHCSRPLTEELLVSADLLVGMTHGHVGMLSELAPEIAARSRLLNANGMDLSDPVGLDQAVYAECAARIWADLEILLADVLAATSPPAANP